MELPNITAVAGKVKGTWPHAVLGPKLAAWKSSINDVSRRGWGGCCRTTHYLSQLSVSSVEGQECYYQLLAASSIQELKIQHNSKSRCDRHSRSKRNTTTEWAKDLPPLEEEEAVCIKPFIKGQKKWHKSRIVERLDNRSYDVAIEDGTILRRNRVHMKPDTGTSMPEDNNTDQMPNHDTPTYLPTTEATTAHTPPEPPTPLPTTPTTPQGWPKRVTKQPARYKDYVM